MDETTLPAILASLNPIEQLRNDYVNFKRGLVPVHMFRSLHTGEWDVESHVGLVCEKMAARLRIGGDGDRAGTQRKALLGEDDATMVFETSKEVTVVTTFDQMSLKEDLLRGIYAYGTCARGAFSCAMCAARGIIVACACCRF